MPSKFDPSKVWRVTGHLELRSNSKKWYARGTGLDGGRFTVGLGVPVLGSRPESLQQVGDRKFVESRVRASDKLADLLNFIRDGGSPKKWRHHASGLSRPKTDALAIADLPQTWRNTFPQPEKTPAQKDASGKTVVAGQTDADYDATTPTMFGDEQKRAIRYLRQGRALLDAFAEWCAIENLIWVSNLESRHAKGFLAAHQTAHCGTAKSYTNLVVSMRGAFSRLGREGFVSTNPFQEAKVDRSAPSVHRIAYTPEEITRILGVAENDRRYRDLAIMVRVAISTGLRKIDCAQLLWESVVLKEGVLSLDPKKKGKHVRIPLLPPLRQTLEEAARSAGPNPSGFVFGALAKRYAAHPEFFTDLLREVLKKIGYGDDQVRLTIKGRKRPASVRDFASLRTTFVTFGIMAGIQDATLAKLTGHATVRLVRETYYQPSDDHLRSEMQKFPPVITGVAAPVTAVIEAEPASDTTQAFLDALDFCGPADVAALKPTLRALAATLPLPAPHRARLIKGVGVLQPSNLDAMRARLVAAAKGQS